MPCPWLGQAARAGGLSLPSRVPFFEKDRYGQQSGDGINQGDMKRRVRGQPGQGDQGQVSTGGGLNRVGGERKIVGAPCFPALQRVAKTGIATKAATVIIMPR